MILSRLSFHPALLLSALLLASGVACAKSSGSVESQMDSPFRLSTNVSDSVSRKESAFPPKAKALMLASTKEEESSLEYGWVTPVLAVTAVALWAGFFWEVGQAVRVRRRERAQLHANQKRGALRNRVATDRLMSVSAVDILLDDIRQPDSYESPARAQDELVAVSLAPDDKEAAIKELATMTEKVDVLLFFNRTARAVETIEAFLDQHPGVSEVPWRHLLALHLKSENWAAYDACLARFKTHFRDADVQPWALALESGQHIRFDNIAAFSVPNSPAQPVLSLSR